VLARLRRFKPALCTPLLVVVLIAALWGAVSRLANTDARSERVSRHLFSEAIGRELGRELAQELPSGGTIAVVRLAPSLWMGAASMLDAELEGIRSAMDGRSVLQVVHPPDPADPEQRAADLLTEAEYRSLVAQVSDAKAVVLQRATFEPAQNSSPNGLPPAFIILGESGSTEQMLKRGFAKAAVAYKAGADWEAVPTRTMPLEQIFGLRYQIIRP
jgi:hypothetical protein